MSPSVPAARSHVVQRCSWAFAGPTAARPIPTSSLCDGAHRRLAVGGWSQVGGQYKYWCGIWSADNAEARALISHNYYLTACALFATGDKLATTDGLGTIIVSDVADGRGTGPLHVAAAKPSMPSNRKAMVCCSSAELRGLARIGSEIAMASWTVASTCSVGHFRNYSPPREPAPPLQSAGDLRLEYSPADPARRQPPQLTVRRANAAVATLPFREEAGWHALSYSFLRSADLGATNPIALGMESGEMTCYRPGNFLSLRTFSGHTDRVWSAAESPVATYSSAAPATALFARGPSASLSPGAISPPTPTTPDASPISSPALPQPAPLSVWATVFSASTAPRWKTWANSLVVANGRSSRVNPHKSKLSIQLRAPSITTSSSRMPVTSSVRSITLTYPPTVATGSSGRPTATTTLRQAPRRGLAGKSTAANSSRPSSCLYRNSARNSIVPMSSMKSSAPAASPRAPRFRSPRQTTSFLRQAVTLRLSCP